MNKLALSLVTAGIVGLASAPAFAFGGHQGGLDPNNPVQHTGAYADPNNLVSIPYVMGPAPAANVDAVTGVPATQPSDAVEQNRGSVPG